MIGVIAGVVSYRIAVAELPMSASLADDSAAAIVVVSGDGRWDEGVRAAAAAGAAAVIVSRPSPVAAERIEGLVADLGALPVVVERPYLRHDTMADVPHARRGEGAQPAVIAVDAVATASAFEPVLRDAVGWVRVLSGERPVLTAASEGLALFSAPRPEGVPAVLTAVRVLTGSDRISAQALGEVRCEIDASEAGAVVSSVTTGGRTTAPRRHESRERLSLRRAIEAVHAGMPTSDLADLASDADAAAEVTRSIARS